MVITATLGFGGFCIRRCLQFGLHVSAVGRNATPKRRSNVNPRANMELHDYLWLLPATF